METLIENEITVEMIHNDFFTMENFIFELEKTEIDKDLKVKYQNLQELGVNYHNIFFHNYKEMEKSIKINNEIVDLQPKCQYYKNKYPFYKLIDRYSIENLCEKYNLCLNVISEYIEEIPDKNLNEIIKAKKNIDKTDLILWDVKSVYIASSDRLAEIMVIAPKNYFDRFRDEKINYVPKALRQNKKIDDPIVLMPVKHNEKKKLDLREIPKLYLILSAWGPEANDELVVNEKLN
jgi:hypothetical protein